MRSRRAAHRALAQRRRPAGDAHRAQQVGVEDQAAAVLAERRARAWRRAVSRYSRSDGSSSIGGEPLGRLRDRAWPPCTAGSRRRTGAPYRSMPSTWLITSSAAALEQLHVDVAERLEPAAEPRRGAPHALGDRADAAVPAGEQGDDPVGLAQLLHPQDDRVVAVSLPLNPTPDMSDSPQKPRRRSCFGSRCQSLATLTCRSR